MKLIILALFNLYFISKQLPCLADSLNNEQKIDAILKLANKTKSPLYFYHWGDRTYLNQLIQNGTWSEKEFKKMMTPKVGTDQGVSLNSVAGSGFYVAETPSGSSIYSLSIHNKDPYLIEVKIDKETLYIDLTDNDIIEKLSDRSITVEDVYKLNPPLIIKYYDDPSWWVIKIRSGLSFRTYRGYHFTYDKINEFSYEFYTKSSRTIFLNDKEKAQNLSYENESLTESWERNTWQYNLVHQKLNKNWDYKDFLGNSTNYYSKTIYHDQNYVQIDWPYYNYLQENRYISSKSSLDGLCKHYGYQNGISKTVRSLYIWNSNNSIKIDSDGYPTRYDKRSAKAVARIQCSLKSAQ